MSEKQRAASAKASSAVEEPPQVSPEVAAAVKVRCPYCRDTCSPAGSVACRDCLARHHAACWEEGGACSSCGSKQRLVAEGQAGTTTEDLIALLRAGRREQVLQHYRDQGLAPEEALQAAAELAFAELARVGPATSTPVARPLFGLQAVLLLGLALCCGFASVGAPTIAGGVLLGLTALGLGGSADWRALVRQLGLGLGGVLMALVLIVSLHLGPRDHSLSLMVLGLVLAVRSAFLARGSGKRE